MTGSGNVSGAKVSKGLKVLLGGAGVLGAAADNANSAKNAANRLRKILMAKLKLPD